MIYQGTKSTKYINMKDRESDTYIDVTSWTFRAALRRQPGATDALAELTIDNGGFAIVDGVNGRIALILTPEVTAVLPVGRIYFDVLRTDQLDGDVWIFGGSFSVKQPITR